MWETDKNKANMHEQEQTQKQEILSSGMLGIHVHVTCSHSFNES